jgi:hypothetical protein
VVEGEETKAATLFEVVRIDPARVSWLRPDGVAATSARPD